MRFIKEILLISIIISLLPAFAMGALSDVSMDSLSYTLIAPPAGSPSDPYSFESIRIDLVLTNNGPALTASEMQANIPSISSQNFVITYGPVYVTTAGYWNPTTSFGTGQKAIAMVYGYYNSSGSKQRTAVFNGNTLSNTGTVLSVPSTCQDSDASNQYNKGWVVGITDCADQSSCFTVSRSQDTCNSPTQMIEFICAVDPQDGMIKKYYNSITCDCVDGKCAGVNNPPVLASIGAKSVNEGQQLTFTISATDVDGNTLTYSASGLPTGAIFNAATRTFSWTPTYTQSGSYTVTFSVNDGNGGTDSETITITVNNVNRAPVLAAIGNKIVNENQLLTFTISATDADGDVLVYSAYTLPSGASFNAGSRTFSWTPTYTQSGSYEITFTVSDGQSVDIESIWITVNDVCIENWVADINSCQATDLRLISYTDLNHCGTANSLPADNGTSVPCDYCTPSWTLNSTWTVCDATEIQYKNYFDINTCYAITNLPSDLLGKPSPLTQTCFFDNDGDGFAEDQGDCDDTNPNRFPGNIEACDNIDNDCNTGTSDGINESWFATACDGTDTDLCMEGTYQCTIGVQTCSDNTGNNLEICNMVDDDCNGDTSDGVDEAWYGQPTVCGVGECASIGNYMCLSAAKVDSCLPGTPVPETCDNKDNDCNGVDDNGVLLTFYLDFDNDLFGNTSVSQQACVAPNDYVSDNTDCNDNNGAVNPGATEILNNGIDDDCNPATSDSSLDVDNDNDGWTENEGDCNDANPDVNPGMIEVPYDGLDNDCNAATKDNDLDNDGHLLADDCNDNDNSVFANMTAWVDNDGDQATVGGALTLCTDGTIPAGYYAPNSATEDCDDNDANRSPLWIEVIYNGIDDDCNAATRDDDLDNDGYGIAVDCDDLSSSINPGMPEVCNNVDDDCNAATIDGIGESWYNDITTCGVGECAASGLMTCNAGTMTDTCVAGTPVAETCDGLDNDCNGVDDNGVLLTFYLDFDNDLFGNASVSQQACVAPSDYVSDNTDCNDKFAMINPGMPEIYYNSVDDDCNPLTVDGDQDNDGYDHIGDCNDVNASLYLWITGYVDNDEDTYTVGNSVNLCTNGTIPVGYSETRKDTDCDDSNPSIYIDTTYYWDNDFDGFTMGGPTTECSNGAIPFGATLTYSPEDCNNFDAGINPNATEIPYNGIDEDCAAGDLIDVDGDGYNYTVDCNDNNEFVFVNMTYYWDNDADGFTMGGPTTICTDGGIPFGAVLYHNPEDCNDFNASVNPNATEPENNCVNDAPVLSAVANQTVVAGQLISIQLSAYDPEFDILTYGTDSIFGSLNISTGLFTWTPTNADAGTHNIIFNVTDGTFTDSIDVNITVLERNATETEGVGYIVSQLPGGATVEYNVSMYYQPIGNLVFDVRAEWIDNGKTVIAYFEYNSAADKMNPSEQALIDAYANSYLPFVYTVESNTQAGIESETLIKVADANSKV